MINFRSYELKKEFEIDYHKSNEHVTLNLEIDFYNAPCQLVSIDYRDFLGQLVDDIKIEKMHLDSNHEVAVVISFLLRYI